jgi:PLP dependent protein
MSFWSMPNPSSTIASNLHRIRDRIATAAVSAGRSPDDITLVAVSKTHPVDAVREALAAAQLVFGENRVQEADAKFPSLRPEHPALRLHLIGPLQTNKVRDALRIADMIETLDRPRLADALAAAMKQERLPQLLIQVNVGAEPQKAGIAREDTDRFIEDCRSRFGAALAGLMCIPPATEDPEPHFAWLTDRATRHGLPTISMGMSGDFEAAIRQGATQIRVGTAIFGGR